MTFSILHNRYSSGRPFFLRDRRQFFAFFFVPFLSVFRFNYAVQRCRSKHEHPIVASSKVLARYMGRTKGRRERASKWLSKVFKCSPRSTRIPLSPTLAIFKSAVVPLTSIAVAFKFYFLLKTTTFTFLESLSIKWFASDLYVQMEHVYLLFYLIDASFLFPFDGSWYVLLLVHDVPMKLSSLVPAKCCTWRPGKTC